MFMRMAMVGACALLVAGAQAQQAGATPLLRRDAAVEAIIVPSDDPRYADHNPAVHEPRILLRNAGTDPLEGISIKYGTEGFLPRMFAWTGHLGSGASVEVVLPHLIDQRPGTNTFTVSLGDPNGRKDQDRTNNTRTSTFTSAPVLVAPLTVRWRVPAGVGGTLRLQNTRGPLPLDRSWRAGPDTVWQEVVELPNGSYFLHVQDSSRTAHAAVRITDAEGHLIHALRSKPRTGATYQFRVESNATPLASPWADAQLINLPGRGQALADVYTQEKALLVVTDGNGEPVEEWHIAPYTEVVQRIDLSARPAGSYGIKLLGKGTELSLGSIDLFDAGPR